MDKLLYTNLIKSTSAYAQLKNDLVSDNVAHSYMFVSNDNMALVTLSRMFSSAIVRGTEAERELVYSGKHSDVIEKPNLNAEKKKGITVADIDDIKKSLLITPLRGDKKVYILYAFDGINPQSQNKLLKTLEEPPGNTTFIICCSLTASVLPTIASRCKQVEIKPFLKPNLIEALMVNYKEREKVEFGVSVSNGSLTSSINMLESKKENNLFGACLEILATTNTSRDILTGASKLVSYKDMISSALNYIEMILRDAMMINLGQDNYVALEQEKEQLQIIASKYSIKAIEKIMPMLNEARARIKTNGNTNSVVDKLMFGMVESKTKYA